MDTLAEWLTLNKKKRARKPAATTTTNNKNGKKSKTNNHNNNRTTTATNQDSSRGGLSQRSGFCPPGRASSKSKERRAKQNRGRRAREKKTFALISIFLKVNLKDKTLRARRAGLNQTKLFEHEAQQ
jgi:hypothetical protein